MWVVHGICRPRGAPLALSTSAGDTYHTWAFSRTPVLCRCKLLLHVNQGCKQSWIHHFVQSNMHKWLTEKNIENKHSLIRIDQPRFQIHPLQVPVLSCIYLPQDAVCLKPGAHYIRLKMHTQKQQQKAVELPRAGKSLNEQWGREVEGQMESEGMEQCIEKLECLKNKSLTYFQQSFWKLHPKWLLHGHRREASNGADTGAAVQYPQNPTAFLRELEAGFIYYRLPTQDSRPISEKKLNTPAVLLKTNNMALMLASASKPLKGKPWQQGLLKKSKPHERLWGRRKRICKFCNRLYKAASRCTASEILMVQWKTCTWSMT